MGAADCKDCAPGRHCEHHKLLARMSYRRRTAKAGGYRQCFRCLGKHLNGERNCPLAAEYEGTP